ncbi:hypothetical protein HWN40_13245 [Methanolobus zinderi]|uniref:Uncharacterized protein n=1 Tax=Methanolobus zinderi TaxID=536044 RepID=A0A7D5EAR2_9EURY|nr:hypothetical protein [Methanolobus zinderi]QLC51115.1 hypothetical protein HWN40_13245 [Methanolobus zinderi]
MLNVSTTDIILFQNQLYVSDHFLAQYVQALLTVAIICSIGGFGTALLLNDVIVPYLKYHLQLDREEIETTVNQMQD